MVDSSLFTDKANSKNPTCEIVENDINRFIRYCANPTTVPITNDKSEVVSSKFCQMFILSKAICNSSKKTKMEILGITVNQVVTIVGTPSYTSGAQLWKGAAATLNRKPTPMISTPSITPCDIFSCPLTETRL